jgi:hypothetical protein
VLHLVDRLLPDEVAQAVVTPVVAHLCMEKVLVDCRELLFESAVELRNDLSVTTHEPPPSRRATDSLVRADIVR